MWNILYICTKKRESLQSVAGTHFVLIHLWVLSPFVQLSDSPLVLVYIWEWIHGERLGAFISWPVGRLSKADELLRTCCKLGRQWSIVVHTLSTTIYSAPVLPRLHLEANIYQRLVKILFWIDVVFLFSFFLSHSHSFLFAASSFHFKSQLWRWMSWHVAQDKLPLPQPP